MIRFDETTFGALNADAYDELHDPGTTEESVALISELAGKSRILELAIGTGRMALPLAARGHDVSGIEGSPEMIAKLRAKPGGASLRVVQGDMANVAIDGPFDFAFLVFNTLFNLPDQESQIRLFANMARKLAPGGQFLVEAFVPEFSGFTNHQRLATKSMGMETLCIEAVQHDPVQQTLHFQRAHISNSGTRLVPLPLRYAYPAEIDLMARLAGLTLQARWGGWHRQEFTAESKMHVSLYKKADS